MEINSEPDLHQWVDHQVASLTPPEAHEPDTAAGLARFRSARVARTRRVRAWMLAGGVIIAAGAVTLAFPGPRVLAQRCVDACLAETGIVVPHRSVAVGGRRPAPDFVLRDAYGATVSLGSLRGKVVLLNFWATWCTPCKVEIPWFTTIHQQFRDAGLAVVGVAMDDDGWEQVRPAMASLGIDYPVVLGDEDLSTKYDGIEALPTTFLIDRSGRIAAVHQGLVAKSTYDAEIQALLAEQ